MPENQPTSTLHEAVHDLRTTQSARVTLAGQMVPTVGVSYYIGQHGPFTDQYDANTFDHETAQQGILKRVYQVQQLDVGLPGSKVEVAQPTTTLHVGEHPTGGPPPTIYKVTSTPHAPIRYTPPR